MKIIHVKGFSPEAPPTKIRYKIYKGNYCVFSQAHYDPAITSSINLAEVIAKDICELEELLLADTKFFDFQSSEGILSLSGSLPGEYEYDQVIFDESGRAHDWKNTICPPEVVQDFGIGPSPKQINLPKDKE